MSNSVSEGQTINKPRVTSLVRRHMLQVGATLLISALILFISSGRLDWLMA